VISAGDSSLDTQLGKEWAAAKVVAPNRVRHRSGAEMETLHFGQDREPIFGVLHRPAGRARGVVVVCSPPYAEAPRNQRREILLGWLASRDGLAVVRFHPRGTGHSSGDGSALSLETMLEDTLDVAREAVERVGAPLLGWVGTRVGAVVAQRAADAYPGSAVAWWQPVLDARSYMKELFRAAMIGALKRGETVTAAQLEAELRANGGVEVVGYRIGRPFYESVFARPLTSVTDGPRRGLLVQMSQRSDLLPPYEAFRGRLAASRWSVTVKLVPAEETWWFGAQGRGRDLERQSVALEAVSHTAEFFRSGAEGAAS
jgi:hypothetical protein